MSLYDQLVSLKDYQNALYEISTRIEDAQAKIAKCERTKSVDDHVAAALELSGLEIMMTNFASALRKGFTT